MPPTEKTDYNQIAADYVESKKKPWRKYVEDYSFLRLIGDVSGKRVIDLACGAGHFTRKVKERGAAEVFGVDLSEAMIHIAQQEEASAPLDIRYAVEDVCTTGEAEQFELAVSAWLLVYAQTLVELDQFCAGVARRVAPGGRFVTFTTDPDVYFHEKQDYRKYDIHLELEDEAREGALIRFHLLNGGEECVVDNYYLPKEAYRDALLKAGFDEVIFHGLEVSPEAEEPAFWDDFVQYPLAFMIEAFKA
ncbi:class I SAM-dependent methyltransferase [Cerasicoccus maritimus]|uniref:class I SAM-dependent methyltransferase n=1 Tax=Cerasicoccus maritimus TaxID=490089 RepID=UPI002852C44B|nr:class I SAM-dependent methyltransferase [Cerasicoccus maritimus]